VSGAIAITYGNYKKKLAKARVIGLKRKFGIAVEQKIVAIILAFTKLSCSYDSKQVGLTNA
jgi:hypothetical protein